MSNFDIPKGFGNPLLSDCCDFVGLELGKEWAYSFRLQSSYEDKKYFILLVTLTGSQTYVEQPSNNFAIIKYSKGFRPLFNMHYT